MRVDNQYANELLQAFRKGKRIADFMDAVSGVENYRLDNLSRQGCIRGMFTKELIADQFLIELEDIVSVFWRGVFENADKAKLWGEEIKIKSNNSKKDEIRATNNNPIHYIRTQASYAVRNYITSLYRKNLQQSCAVCGHTTAIKNNKQCKCGQVMTTTYKFVEIKEDTDQFQQDLSFQVVQNNNMESRITAILDDFGNKVLGNTTRAYQVLKIITDPQASIEMCSACRMCNAKTFDIDSCVNYNANIGKYLGVNKTMIANKMRRIRKAFPEFLYQEETVEATYLLDLIPTKYRALSTIVD